MSYTLFGITNCDTVRKARRWLDEHRVAYDFQDLRADGLDRSLVGEWIEACGWEAVVNRRSTSWKALDQQQREQMDNDSALDAILATPTLVKRPVLVGADLLEFGFKADRYADLLC